MIRHHLQPLYQLAEHMIKEKLGSRGQIDNHDTTMTK